MKLKSQSINNKNPKQQMKKVVMRTAAGVELLFNFDTQKFESSNWEAVNAALEEDLHNSKDPIGVVNATEVQRFIKLYGIANPS